MCTLPSIERIPKSARRPVKLSKSMSCLAQEAFVAEWCGPVKKEIELLMHGDACSAILILRATLKISVQSTARICFAPSLRWFAWNYILKKGDEEKGSAAFASDFDALLSLEQTPSGTGLSP